LKFFKIKKMHTQLKLILLTALTFSVVHVPDRALAALSVRNTQICLQRLGYFKGPVTGNLGPLTKNAITRFQQANGLPAIGSVGPRTQQLLQSRCQGRITSRPSRRRPPVIPPGNYSNSTNYSSSYSGDNYSSSYSSSYTNTYSGDLRVGSTGINVENLQRNLKSLGYYSDRITGYFGEITKQAVIRFQQATQLPVTGVADIRTLQEINFRISDQSTGRNEPTIQLGARGESVRQLQESLQKLGFFAKNEIADGNFDQYTKDAVTNFQLSVGLPSNGIVDQRTWQTLWQQVGRGTNPRDDRSYVVVIPLDKEETFDKVQSLFSQVGLNNQAQKRDSRLGRYIEAGKYRDLDSAEKLSKWLRDRGFDARVVKAGRF
jgi:peptidoglycan hydrolase-like protein with peptidoglycan-binding domain